MVTTVQSKRLRNNLVLRCAALHKGLTISAVADNVVIEVLPIAPQRWCSSYYERKSDAGRRSAEVPVRAEAVPARGVSSMVPIGVASCCAKVARLRA